jgi:hypothetical protein
MTRELFKKANKLNDEIYELNSFIGYVSSDRDKECTIMLTKLSPFVKCKLILFLENIISEQSDKFDQL